MLGDERPLAVDREQLAPGRVLVVDVRVEVRVEVDVEHARGTFGPLQVAGHPVQGLGDTAQHQLRRTQVSFEPPPCEELTTSEPRRIAARVSPPGTIETSSP